MTDAWTAGQGRNLVVLTGDVHAHWAADVKQRFDDPDSPVIGTELVSCSVTSGGDGSESASSAPTVLAENPHIRFHSNRRGYVRTRVAPEALTAEFRVLPYVRRSGAPAETRATFVVEDGRAGLNPA